jgi:hypothetical protein
MNPTRLLSIVLFCACVAVLPAQVIITGYVETGNLPSNDDRHSGNWGAGEGNLGNSEGEALGFMINFGGTAYTRTFISNNGFITFGGGSGAYWPYPIDENYVANGYPGLPIIAPFFSDVDTRNALSGIVSWGTAMVDGHAAFVVHWPSVGEYGASPFSPNTFSLILVSRTDLGPGDFDLIFNYENITWDHSNAVAGFHNGSSTNPIFYQVPGSGTAGAFLHDGPNSLVASTNANFAGGYLLQARDGGFLTPAAIVPIPEPSTYALFALGVIVIGLGHLRRRKVS